MNREELELIEMLGLSHIKIVPITPEEQEAVKQGMLEADEEEDQLIEQEYKRYLDYQYCTVLQCQGQY